MLHSRSQVEGEWHMTQSVPLTFVQFVLLQIIIWLTVGRLAWFVNAWLER
jgi:hypothetical protein